MRFKVFLVLAFFVCILMPGMSHAQNKVVVIPLMQDAPPPEPYAPLAAQSPPNAAYGIGTNTVRDKVTGLLWQKVDDNITWTWEAAFDFCRRLEILEWYGGFPIIWANWRLPSKDELASIVDYDNWGPAINSIAFPGTNSGVYWSSTTDAYISAEAWGVNFDSGSVFGVGKSAANYARCVRGNFIRDNIFKNNDNGTVTDLSTGLTWQQQEDNDTKTWFEANTYCNGLGLAGGGWRLPNIKELQSILDNRIHNPAIDTDVFSGTHSAHYWSSTTYQFDLGYAWGVYFSYGNIGFDAKIFNSSYVRCVR